MARAWNGTRGTCYDRGYVVLKQWKKERKKTAMLAKMLVKKENKIKKGGGVIMLLHIPERHLAMGE